MMEEDQASDVEPESSNVAVEPIAQGIDSKQILIGRRARLSRTQCICRFKHARHPESSI